MCVGYSYRILWSVLLKAVRSKVILRVMLYWRMTLKNHEITTSPVSNDRIVLFWTNIWVICYFSLSAYRKILQIMSLASWPTQRECYLKIYQVCWYMYLLPFMWSLIFIGKDLLSTTTKCVSWHRNTLDAYNPMDFVTPFL